MSPLEPNPARERFARRLRELRVVRGFKTARSLAGALAIDENRYTRYERAEVEPDIGLIHRICETLRLSPNELFGLADEKSIPSRAPAGPGFAEADDGYPVPGSAGDHDKRARATWMLACAVAELQSNAGEARAERPPLARLQLAARLFNDLVRRPYAAVSEILLLPAISEASAKEAQYIGDLVEELTQLST